MRKCKTLYILRRKELENLNNFSLKISQNWKLRIFFLQFCEFSVILRFNLYKILDFDSNNLYTHFCFSELLILREKKVRGFFWAKKFKISKKYWKKSYWRFTQKRYYFAPGVANNTFFYSSCTLSDSSRIIFFFTKPFKQKSKY